MGRPEVITKYCPSCKGWNVRNRLYERKGNVKTPIGWHCEKCGGIYLDEEPARMR